MSTRTLAELAIELGGTVLGDDSLMIRGVAGIREAQPGDVTFLANSRYEGYLAETRATAVICDRQPRHAPVPLLQVDHPYLAFQKAVRLFRPRPYPRRRGRRRGSPPAPPGTRGSRCCGSIIRPWRSRRRCGCPGPSSPSRCRAC